MSRGANIETPSLESVEGYLVQNNFEIPEMKKKKVDRLKGAFSSFFVCDWI